MSTGDVTGRVAAVTGGNGFLGSAIVAALSAAGWRIRLLARGALDHPVLSGIALQQVSGDLADAAAVAELVRDADLVVHAAGLVKARTRQHFLAVNRDGTARLAEAVKRLPRPPRFILISSQAAREPSLSDYAASKRLGEAAAEAVLAGRPCMVLRPCVIYGPWDREGRALLRLAGSRIAPAVRAPEPRIAMIHVRDAAAAVAAAASGGPEVGVFEICDERADGYGWRELLRRLGEANGRVPRAVAVPDLLIRAAGSANELLALAGGPPAMFGAGKAREILHRDWSADPARRLSAALWQPRIALTEGLAETVAWARSRRGVPRSR
ncbi:NAD-dependent epimerase/dehydratase family protein [Lichenicoccus roseus]|uniref:NAD-dependent epimerase/dehydratase family protein n=1 Tax=Lichenicoccus roseus TaxID=2683649 RepID=UPI001486AE3D|nr:NAD-dependent epimerase/dehydratase family protein [Lichenicoccus roseus]